MISRFVKCYCLVFILCGSALAEDTNLSRIQKSVADKEVELNALRNRQKSLRVNLSEKSKQLKQLRARASNISEELNKLEIAIVEEERAIAELDAQLAEIKVRSAKRLRLMYMRRGLAQNARMALFAHSDSISRDAYFITKISAQDNTVWKALLRKQQKREAIKENMQSLVADQDRFKEILFEEQRQIEQSMQDEVRLQAKLEQEKQSIERVLVSLRAEALRLETVLKSLTGEGRVAVAQSDFLSLHGEAAVVEKFIGKGLKKGTLKFPIIGGTLIKQFGQKSPSFKGFLVSKGQWYSVKSNSQVTSIAYGKVMYIGKMPAYGTIVIVDHGERYYSLYGRLKEVKVSVGSILKQGSAIGIVEDSTEKNMENFYFELRKAGNSIDPRTYF